MRMIVLLMGLLLAASMVLAADLQASFGNAGDNQLYFGPGLIDNQAFFDQPVPLVTTHGGGPLFSLSGNVINQPNATAIIAEPLPLPAKKYVGVLEGTPVNMALLGLVVILLIIIFKRRKRQ